MEDNRASLTAPAPVNTTAIDTLMPHRQVQAAKPKGRYTGGFFEGDGLNAFPEFSSDGINSVSPEWNTVEEIQFFDDSRTQRLVIITRRHRFEIKGLRLETVWKAVKQKRMSAVSPSSPSSMLDASKPFIESVEIVRMEEGEG